MAIQSIDTEGNIEWRCPHMTEEADQPCGAIYQHHISHEHIQWHGMPGVKPEHQTVSLPPCSGCGAQTFLKVHFTEKELKAPNMWLEWNSQRAELLQKLQKLLPEAEPGSAQQAALTQQIALLEKIRDAKGAHTESHAMAQRHMQLRDQLIASGKTPTTS